MKEQKHIDKLFKEQLKDFEVAPSDKIWENIHQELHPERKKRRVIPIWWRVAGVAAGLLLLVSIGYQMFSPDNSSLIEPTIVNQNPSESTENEGTEENTVTPQDQNSGSVIQDDKTQVAETNTDDQVKESNDDITSPTNNETRAEEVIASELKNTNKNKSENSSNTSNRKEQNRNAIKDPVINKNSIEDAVVVSDRDQKSESENNESIIKNKTELDAIIKSAKEDQTTTVTDSGQKDNTSNSTNNSNNSDTEDSENEDIIPDPEDTQTNAIENAIAQAEDINEKEKETEKLNRWSVSPNVAPVYYSSLGEGSSIDEQFVSNSKESEINMSYGVTGSYAINDKLKIRAGINRVDVGYTTNDVLIFENSNLAARTSAPMDNVKMATGNARYSIYSADNFNFNNGPTVLLTQEQGSLDQQLGFIEVPIELEYSLLEKKFGVNLIGGFSTFFLNQNDIFAVFSDGERTRIGDASNVRDMSYSANFGIGLDYNFSKQWQLNLEPTFKYQLNTFSNTSGDFQPFLIGVYTGLSFKF